MARSNHQTPWRSASPDRSAVAFTRVAASGAPDAMASSSRWRFWVVGAAIVVVGAWLRLWHLGDAPFSHDEAIHAHFSLHFAAYSYDPTYHGPLLYHLVAACFQLLGDSDWSARLVPAALGIALLVLALGTRRWLNGGALCASALLAISPCMTSYSRRLIHDALVLLLTLGAVLCFQIAREKSSSTIAGRAARIGLTVLCALLLATKANAWFIIAMLLGFWLVQAARDAVSFFQPLWTNGEKLRSEAMADARHRNPGADNLAQRKVGGAKHGDAWHKRAWNRWLPCGLLLVVALSSNRVRYRPLTPVPDYVVQSSDAAWTIGESTFTFGCIAAVLLMMEWLRRAPDNRESQASSATSDDATTTQAQADENATAHRSVWNWPLLWILVISLACGFFVLAFLYGHGVLWWRAPEQIATRLRAEVLGPDSALPRMLAYWGGQQKAPRLPGPHDYYIVLMLLYELPLAVPAVAGIVRASRHRTPFTDLLLWWAFTSFALYSLANEKVPWLLVHITLPMSLLAGNWLWHRTRELWPCMSTHATLQSAAATQLSLNGAFPIATQKQTAQPAASATVASATVASRTSPSSVEAKKASEVKKASAKNATKSGARARATAKATLARDLESSRLAMRLTWRRGVFIAGCVAGALFLARGVAATSFGRSGDNHEPLFYANSTEAFHDALLRALRRTQGRPGALWVGAEKEWPNVWYLRPGAPLVDASPGVFSIVPQMVPSADPARAGAVRVAQSPTLEEWKTMLAKGQVSLPEWQAMQRQLDGRQGETVDFIIWPRAAWSALRPQTFVRFWMFREANDSNGVLSEWSHNKVVISTPPDGKQVRGK